MFGSLITLGIGVLILFGSGGSSVIGWIFTVWGGFAVLGSLSEDEDGYEGIDPEFQPQARVISDTFHAEDSESEPMPVLSVEFKGLLPIPHSTDLVFVTTALDITDPDEPKPIISHYEGLQEANTIAYQRRVDLGRRDAGDYATEWMHAGALLTELVTPPSSGRRKLLINLFLIDNENPTPFNLGFPDTDHGGFLWGDSVEYFHDFEQKGYTEVYEGMREARVLAIKIAMAVAMADGSLDQTEGMALKNWITRIIGVADDEDDEMKDALNGAMKDSYEQAVAGELVLSDLCGRLNEIDLEPQKYETLQLCYDVMVADGVADPNELEVIKQIATAWEIDPEEEARIRDSVIADINLSSGAELEVILGIDPTWDQKKIRRYLRKEFQKWNNRINVVEGTERDHAQQMLDLIAKARQKYE